MHKTLLFLLLLANYAVWGQTDPVKVYHGFSGGMMLHSGCLFGRDENAPRDAEGVLCSPQGATFGLGGALRIHLFRHLRVGGEGLVSTMNSAATDCWNRLQSGSYIRTGCGGVSADAYWRCNKVWPYIGGVLGGGAMRALYVIEGSEDDWREEPRSVFHKQPFFYVCPYVGFDWCLTGKVHLTFRLDWLLALHQRKLVLPTGPRLYLGFMFCH